MSSTPDSLWFDEPEPDIRHEARVVEASDRGSWQAPEPDEPDWDDPHHLLPTGETHAIGSDSDFPAGDEMAPEGPTGGGLDVDAGLGQPDTDGTPVAIREARLADTRRPRRPSASVAPGKNGRPGPAGGTLGRVGRGVVWVRASELLTQASGRLAGRGIWLESELARRARSLPVEAGRAVGRSVGRLPPVTAFGRGTPTPAATTRPAINSTR